MSEMGMESQRVCLSKIGTYTLTPALGVAPFDQALAVGAREEDTWSARTRNARTSTSTANILAERERCDYVTQIDSTMIHPPSALLSHGVDTDQGHRVWRMKPCPLGYHVLPMQ